MYKQIVLIRDDIEMSKGKAIVQACHACIGALDKTNPSVISNWKKEGQKKVAVYGDLDTLKKCEKKAESVNMPNYKVNDAGLTELKPGTITALAIGPAKENEVDKITFSLRLVD